MKNLFVLHKQLNNGNQRQKTRTGHECVRECVAHFHIVVAQHNFACPPTLYEIVSFVSGTKKKKMTPII